MWTEVSQSQSLFMCCYLSAIKINWNCLWSKTEDTISVVSSSVFWSAVL